MEFSFKHNYYLMLFSGVCLTNICDARSHVCNGKTSLHYTDVNAEKLLNSDGFAAGLCYLKLHLVISFAV